jgi:hypothetical protein
VERGGDGPRGLQPLIGRAEESVRANTMASFFPGFQSTDKS